MKTILPWIVAALAIGAAVFLFNANKSKNATVTTLEAKVREVETLRHEIAELKKQQVAPAEIEQLRKDKEDLLRLRNEVSQLRNKEKELAKQAQSAQAALAGAQQQQAQQLQQLQAANQQLLGSVQAQQTALLNACINNLRQIDGARQQWALENQRTAEAIPTAQDIAPYLKDGLIPTCPAAGKYSLNALNSAPTCSVTGHALPQP